MSNKPKWWNFSQELWEKYEYIIKKFNKNPLPQVKISQLEKEIDKRDARINEINDYITRAVRIYENGAVTYISESEYEFQSEVFGFFQDYIEELNGVKDEYDNPKDLYKFRDCLCCEKPFKSKNNNRLCYNCKRTNGEHGYNVKNQRDKYGNKTTGYGR